MENIFKLHQLQVKLGPLSTGSLENEMLSLIPADLSRTF